MPSVRVWSLHVGRFIHWGGGGGLLALATCAICLLFVASFTYELSYIWKTQRYGMVSERVSEHYAFHLNQKIAALFFSLSLPLSLSFLVSQKSASTRRYKKCKTSLFKSTVKYFFLPGSSPLKTFFHDEIKFSTPICKLQLTANYRLTMGHELKTYQSIQNSTLIFVSNLLVEQD